MLTGFFDGVQDMSIFTDIVGLQSAGAVPDARCFQDGAVTAGSTTLTSASGAAFVQGDKKKTLVVPYGNCPLVDFTVDTNGVALPSHTPDINNGNVWVAGKGTARIESNVIQAHTFDATTHTCVQTFNTGLVNHDWYGQVQFTNASANGGLIVRATDSANYWVVYLDPSAQVFQIYEVVTSSFAQRGTELTGLSLVTSHYYGIRVKVTGTTITASLYDTATLAQIGTDITYTSMATGLTATRVGLLGQGLADNVYWQLLRAMPYGSTSLHLLPTVTAVASATSVTLSTASLSTQTAVFCALGTPADGSITKALAALGTQGGTVYASAGIYLFTGAGFSVPENCQVVGANQGLTCHILNNVGANGTPPTAQIAGLNPDGYGGGTIFYTCGTSVIPGPALIVPSTFNGTAFLTCLAQGAVQGICFFNAVQSQQDNIPQANGPIVYLNGDDCLCESCEFLAVNTGVLIGGIGANRCVCNNISGQPLLTGVGSFNTYDSIRLTNLHFNPWWAYTNNGGSKVFTWQLANGFGVYLGHNDGVICANWLVLGYASDLLLVKYDDSSGAGNYGTWGAFVNINLDASPIPLNITWIGPSAKLMFTNLQTFGSSTGNPGVYIQGTVSTQSKIGFVNCAFSAVTTTAYGIAVVASGTLQMSVVGCDFEAFGTGGIGTVGAAGQFRVTGCQFVSTGKPPLIFDAASSANATYTGNIGTGTANSNAGSGTITAAGNVT